MEEQPDKRRGTIGLKLSMCFVLALQRASAAEASPAAASSFHVLFCFAPPPFFTKHRVFFSQVVSGR